VPESFTVTVAQPERLATQAQGIDDAKLVGAIDSLSAAVAAMREGDDPRLTLEVALLKVSTPSLDSSREALLRRIESLESRLAGGPGGDAAPVSAPAPPAEDVAPAAPPEDDPPSEESEPQSSVATVSIEIERVVEVWPAVVAHLRDSGSAMLSTLFDEAKPLGIDQEREVIRIGFPESAKFNKKKAESSANIERMAEAIGSVAGQRLRPVYELIDGQNEPADEERKPDMSEEELVEMVKDSFDADEVVSDESRESGTG
jgi:DNA polymerase-3 subunit gamma/tau